VLFSVLSPDFTLGLKALQIALNALDYMMSWKYVGIAFEYKIDKIDESSLYWELNKID